MIELQRQILLPPQNAGPSGQARAEASSLPVPMVAPVRQTPAQDDRQGAALPEWRRPPIMLEDDGAPPVLADRRAQSRRVGSGLFNGGREASPQDAVGSLAFLAQQIFQESMPTGLYLEPWTQGIGAYRRAGAEPPLVGSGPAMVSLAV